MSWVCLVELVDNIFLHGQHMKCLKSIHSQDKEIYKKVKYKELDMIPLWKTLGSSDKIVATTTLTFYII